MTTTLMFEKDIDLNALFTLNYNFDMLKTILQELLKNNKALTEKVDNQEKTIKANEIKFEKEIFDVKQNFNNEINIINGRLKNHDNDIQDIKDRLNGLDNLKDKFDDLTKRVDKNENNIKDNKDEIEKSKYSNINAHIFPLLILFSTSETQKY